MVQAAIVSPAPILPPDAFKQLEMVGLVGDHLLLLDRLFLVLEPDERELPVEIVFLLEEAIELPEEQFLAEGFAVGLELADSVELVLEVEFGLGDLGVLDLVLLDEFVDVPLEFSELDVGEAVVGKENGFFAVRVLLGLAF